MNSDPKEVPVAIYSRISKFDPPVVGASPSERMRLYCSQRNFSVVREFTDYGELPRVLWSPGSERTAMLRDITEGKAKFKMIVVADLSRIARTAKHLLEVLGILEAARIDLFSMKEGIHSTAQVYSLVRIVEAVVSAEKVILGETIRRTMQNGMKWEGRPRRVTDPRVIERIRDMKASGMTYREIARRLRIGRTVIFRVVKGSYVS